jgi:hypothetical protein
MSKHIRARGCLTVAGAKLDITYEIPGIDHDDSDLAGGLIWFEKKDRQRLAAREHFVLETNTGAVVRGSIAKIHSASAAVVVEV